MEDDFPWKNMNTKTLEREYSPSSCVSNYEDLKRIIKKGGFVRCGWDGSIKTESIIKQETKATIRCILRNQNISDKKCVYSGLKAKYNVIIAKAY